MRILPRSTRQGFHRAGVIMLMYVVALIVVIEAIFGLTNRIIHWFVRMLGLTNFEEKLKQLPWWFAFVLVSIAVLNFAFFDVAHYYFFARREWLLFSGCTILKYASFPIARYFLRMYADKLRARPWINATYEWYVRWRDRLLSWLETKAWYVRALALKHHLMDLVKQQTVLLKEKMHSVKERIKAFIVARQRRSMLRAARRTRAVRARNGQCWGGP